jgi:hypothetical protein
MRDRRLGLIAMSAGFLGIALLQSMAPVAAPPLYDGVVVAEPYRWLTPPAGAEGNPNSASKTLDVTGSTSPLLAVGTGETPPQASVIGVDGALVMPPGTTVIKASITPVQPPAQPADGQIAGNVYRIDVSDQSGTRISPGAGAMVTVVLRGPDGTTNATIERFTGTGWQRLKTDESGFANTWLAIVTDFGDFALLTSAAPSSRGTGLETVPAASARTGAGGAAAGDTTVPIIVVGLVLVVAGIAAVAVARRRSRRQPSRDSPGRTRGRPRGRR